MIGDGLGRALIPAAFGVLLVAWLLRKLATRALRAAVRRGTADPVLARAGVGELAGALVFYGVLLVAVAFLRVGLSEWLLRLCVAFALVAVAVAGARAVRELIGGTVRIPYGGVMVTLGVAAALDVVAFAPSITRPVLIAGLATVAGVVIVGVGGGLIRPMRSRWEAWLEPARVPGRPATDETQVIPQQTDRQEAGPDETVVIHTGGHGAGGPEIGGPGNGGPGNGAQEAGGPGIGGQEAGGQEAEQTQVIATADRRT
ncbi:hypothetical protein [Paractinoplanes brasiliensis]|uniref:Uncharacterized protein n=1 Tax=Paractinoplanes brasiliensis TaxID=52695 RepID=A0A4R6JXQ1_9ACTN|nr:hypothetical protein [Actinoplanes brasiliensis]TDO41499.1 hypothetical protein C8E87_5232 [Actinoplanes brasiliensis]GID27216.1 hypothetical protein Abr02nite_21990 [Actinoplanes brasiliensis]